MKTIIYTILLFVLTLVVSPANAQKCTAEKPNAPDLFQIDATRTSAKLYFTPPASNVTGYTVLYGTERLKNEFGVSFSNNNNKGVVDYTVNDLSPDTKYYFRVRADNDCRPGYTSETLSAQTNWEQKTYTKVKPSTTEEEVSDLPLLTVTPSIDSAEEEFKDIEATSVDETSGDEVSVENVKKPGLLASILDFFKRIFSTLNK